MIEIAHFSFSYGKHSALEDVDLNIEKGEFVLLAGANGSGKTTLLRAVSGVLMPRKGKIRVEGSPVGPSTQRKIAYIPASLSMYETLKIKEAISVHSSFYSGFQYREIADYRFDPDRKINSLSRGEKTLFYLFLALSTSPEYILIDDVIHFLDPHLRDIFLRSILQPIEEQRLGVVIAAQVPADIEGLIDRLVVLNKGKVVLDEQVEVLKQTFVKLYAENEPQGLPVVFRRDWNGMKELYIYPYRGEEIPLSASGKSVEYLGLSEILRAYIGGEYDRH